MRISFWLTSTTRVMGKENWGFAPMGGAEISAVQLGEEFLKLGCEVYYYLQRSIPFDDGNLHIRMHSQALTDEHEYFICVRPHAILSQIKSKYRLLWSGDAFDQTSMQLFWDKKVCDSMNAYVFKSEWQKEKILDKFPYIESPKTHIMYNGYKEWSFQRLKPIPLRFIHTSTWYRGLANFEYIWPKILYYYPTAEIHVFSKTTTYSEVNPKEQGYLALAERLVGIPGIILRESVPQYILYQELQKAWLMLYPNTGFVESSCGSAMQALAVGTPVVATARAGLIETVGNDGILIEEKEGWQDKFIEGVLHLCQSADERNKLAENGQLRMRGFTWQRVASRWQDFLKSL